MRWIAECGGLFDECATALAGAARVGHEVMKVQETGWAYM